MKASVVQAFIVVSGTGEERGNLVKRFYEIASGESSLTDYLVVHSDRMGSLEELIGLSNPKVFVECLKESLLKNGLPRFSDKYSDDYRSEFTKMINELRSRYEKKAINTIKFFLTNGVFV